AARPAALRGVLSRRRLDLLLRDRADPRRPAATRERAVGLDLGPRPRKRPDRGCRLCAQANGDEAQGADRAPAVRARLAPAALDVRRLDRRRPTVAERPRSCPAGAPD